MYKMMIIAKQNFLKFHYNDHMKFAIGGRGPLYTWLQKSKNHRWSLREENELKAKF